VFAEAFFFGHQYRRLDTKPTREDWALWSRDLEVRIANI
jgi:hypothetical protein